MRCFSIAAIARARAYIERARSALAERQRESEELLHDGVAAFNRGEAGEARRLLEAAMLQGRAEREALALLDRLNRLEQGSTPQAQEPVVRTSGGVGLLGVGRRTSGRRTRVIAWSATGLIVIAAAAIFAVPNIEKWRAMLTQPEPQAAPSPSAVERPLPIPRRAETAIARARALAASGRLHDALQALDRVRVTDPLRPEADRLRADIQQQLIARQTGRVREVSEVRLPGLRRSSNAAAIAATTSRWRRRPIPSWKSDPASLPPSSWTISR